MRSRLIARLGFLALFGLAACSPAERIAAPASSASAAFDRAERGGRLSPIEQFALAQGTWCDNATFLDCSGIDQYDIGWIIGRSDFDNAVGPSGDSKFYIFDVGGVNARWWARHHVAPALAPYSISGDVEESRLPDGRRRLRITANARNTFTWFDLDHYDIAGEYLFTDRLYGSDFSQYPGFDPDIPDVTPTLADATADMDLVLPADFKGYPDLIQLIEFPQPGMEIRKMNVTVEAVGRLLHEIDGIPAGTLVRGSVKDDFSFWITPTKAFRAPKFSFTRVRDDGRDGVWHRYSKRLSERERHRRGGH